MLKGENTKKIVIVGAGIIGLTSACRLAESGYDVTVIEQENMPGAGSSKANAGQLLYDRISALGSPGLLRNLPKTLLGSDHGVSASGLAHPSRWSWTSTFLRECTESAWQRNTQHLLEMAHCSRDSMARFINRHDIAFHYRKPGKLIVYQSAKELDAAGKVADFQQQFGGRHQILSRRTCIEREQALTGATRKIVGGVFLPDAEVGDCHSFCQGLADILVNKLNGQIQYGVKITSIDHCNGRVSAVHTDQGSIESDLFVLATGNSSPDFLPAKFLGKKLIIGVKGVSLTFPIGKNPPDLSVTDSTGKFIVLRLGQQVRIAGYAIFSGNLDIRPVDVLRLKNKARALMPEAANYQKAPDVWTGFRPQTPDDLPMIGQAGAENLYVNAGHGSLGWTLAFGSAEILLEKINAYT